MTNRPFLIITALFLGYAILLIPFGEYTLPPDRDYNPGYYSIRKIDAGDDSGYYAFVRSGIIDGDFDFFNERPFWHFDAIGTRGYTLNYWYIGQAILWIPFFLCGHAAAWIYSSLGFPVAMNGYSFPYHTFTFLGSALECFLALLIAFNLLKKRYSVSAALWTSLLVFSATCLPYFTFIRNRMSHTGDILAGFAFVALFFCIRKIRTVHGFFFSCGDCSWVFSWTSGTSAWCMKCFP